MKTEKTTVTTTYEINGLVVTVINGDKPYANVCRGHQEQINFGSQEALVKFCKQFLEEVGE